MRKVIRKGTKGRLDGLKGKRRDSLRGVTMVEGMGVDYASRVGSKGGKWEY